MMKGREDHRSDENCGLGVAPQGSCFSWSRSLALAARRRASPFPRKVLGRLGNTEG